MKKLKTFFATLFISSLLTLPMVGQDMASATDLYNSGAKALSDNNYVGAIDSFNKALKMIEILSPEDRGDEGESMLVEIKSIIPQIYLRYGRGLASSGDITNSLKQLALAVENAKRYNVEGVEEEVNMLKPQLLLANASSLLNGGKFEEAIAGFKEVIAVSPEHRDAHLRLGLAYARLNDEDNAIVAFEKAVELGETANAPRQISNIFLKRSAAAVRTKKWQEVYDNAVKSNQYHISPNGHKLLGLSAVQLKKFKESIESLEAYLSLMPDAKDKNSITYNLATAYEGLGNNAKACGYYKQLLNDATFKEIAEYKVKTALKFN